MTDKIDTGANAVERLSPSEFNGGSMCSNSRGKYVTYDSYTALAAERDALQAEVERLRESLERAAQYVETCQSDEVWLHPNPNKIRDMKGDA